MSSAIQTQLDAKQATLSEGAFADGDKTKLDSVATNADVSPWTLSSGDIYRTSGNVGIGTTVPTAKLTVYGEDDESVASRLLLKVHDKVATNEWTGIGLGGYSTSSLQVCKSAIIHERTAGYGRGSLHLCTNNVGDTTDVNKSNARLTIKADGNVGIGTIGPGKKLSVVGSIVSQTGTSGAGAILLESTSVGGSIWTNTNYSDSAPGDNWGERITIKNGDVGIGKTPGTKLDVNGNIQSVGVYSTDTIRVFSGSTNGSTDDNICLFANGQGIGNPKIVLRRDNGNFYGSEIMGGLAGGGSSPEEITGTQFFAINEVNNGTRSRRLTMLRGGNLGIGTDSPSYKLSVDGTINTSGSFRTSQNIQFTQGEKRMYYNASNTTHMELRPEENVEGSFQYRSLIISKGLTKSGSGSTNSWSLTGSNPGTTNQWGQSSIFVAPRSIYFNVYAASSDPGSWTNSQLYSNTNRMYINSSGDVYIRTNLTVTGSVTENSDSRAKKNQQLYDTSNCLYAIKNIPILTYDYEPWFKTETYDYIPNPNDPSGADIINPSAVNLPRTGVVGFIAQDLLNYPATQGTVKKNRATFIDASDNSYQFDDFHRVSKSRLIAVLMGAIQEQQKIIDAEKAKTATLESQVADLLSRVTALENT